MAFAHVSRTVRDVTGKTFARKFITLGKVINYWADAVGPDLAGKSYPVGMSVRKNVKSGKNATTSTRDLVATLEIAASSAEATLIHYQKKMILERLTLLIGADMIVDIKVVHNSVAALNPQPRTVPFTTAPLTGREKPCLSPDDTGTSAVQDDELRIALERLGQYIDTRNNQSL